MWTFVPWSSLHREQEHEKSYYDVPMRQAGKLPLNKDTRKGKSVTAARVHETQERGRKKRYDNRHTLVYHVGDWSSQRTGPRQESFATTKRDDKINICVGKNQLARSNI